MKSSQFDVIPSATRPASRPDDEPAAVTCTRAASRTSRSRASSKARCTRCDRPTTRPQARVRCYAAVRHSSLYDAKLGMYRVNVPLDEREFRDRPQQDLLAGLAGERVDLPAHALQVPARDAAQRAWRRSSSTTCSAGWWRSRSPRSTAARRWRTPRSSPAAVSPTRRSHGAGFVARLSGATAEWISMVLHMGLGATPFQRGGWRIAFRAAAGAGRLAVHD